MNGGIEGEFEDGTEHEQEKSSTLRANRQHKKWFGAGEREGRNKGMEAMREGKEEKGSEKGAGGGVEETGRKARRK